jgi:hypothetical protein
MKKLLLLLLLFVGLLAQSQTFNNEWINYSRPYYKFKIANTGLYRITQSALAGIGIGSTPAEQFQLWRNGKQIPLYTTVPTGALGAADYIEFWGERNDGKPDNVLYREPDYQINDSWSLHTDTASFFLTVNPAGGNFRYTTMANNIPSGLTPEPYFMHTQGVYYKEDVHKGLSEYISEYTYSSAYDKAEGIASWEIAGQGGVQQEVFNNLFPYTDPSAPQASMRVNATGSNVYTRQFEVKLNNTQVALENMNFYDYRKLDFTVPNALLSSGTATIDIRNLCVDINGRMRLAKTELIYPRLFNFGGADRFLFELPPSTNPGGNYLEISGFNFNGVPPVLYDLANQERYVADITGGTIVKIELPASTVTRKLLLISQHTSVPQLVSNFEQRNFIDYGATANQGNFLIISHPTLLTTTGGTNPVEDYRAYRSSAVGGGHNAKVYMIDQLVDQFAFGIKQHPSAIRNFIRYARLHYTAPIKNVLLIGKGVTYNSQRKPFSNESNPNLQKLALIPTFGDPGSDWLYTSEPGLDQTPLVSIGRISAINGNEVKDYLDKVKQYEQQQAFLSPLIADKAWMKNAVNVVGARETVLSATLTNYLLGYRRVVIDTLFGASVHTFSKSTAATVEQGSSEKLTALFQEGISLLTYFGHSSAATLEFNLDDPSAYNNQSKYPLFQLLGCNAGNFFTFNTARLTTKETISEKYVLAPQRGTIATIASTHFGIANYLDVYNTGFVHALTTTHYGQTLGEIMREAIRSTFALTGQNDFFARFHCEQATLHGDPALPKPDYVIEDNLVKISPQVVSTAENTFKVKAEFMNLGKAINQPTVIELRRTFPNNTTVLVRRDTIPGIRYIDSLHYDLDIVPTRDLGLCKLTFCIDPDNQIDELFETNNCLTKDVFIIDDDIRPVYPYNYAIVNTQGIKVAASTANAFSGTRQYVMEMDTTQLFNSPAKITRNTTSTGGVIEFAPGITFVDSTVYYWRVAPVPTSGQPKWNGFSFVYLQNSFKGFNQSHYYQHTASIGDNIYIEPSNRNWRFDSVTNNLFIRNGVWLTATTQEGDLIVSVNNNPYIRNTCQYGITFNVFEGKSFAPWRNQASGSGGLYGSYNPNCALSRNWNFEYPNTKAGRDNARNFIRDSIPDGNFIVMRSIPQSQDNLNQYVSDWIADRTINGNGNTLYDVLKNNGVNVIDSFTSPKAYIAVYKKGDAGFATQQVVSPGKIEVVNLSVNCKTPDSIGTLVSPLYGPAKAWRQLKWRGAADNVKDTVQLSVIGVSPTGTETVLYNNINTTQQDFDVSGINATAYPYVKLVMYSKDGAAYSPYQLKYWRVTYDPVDIGEPPINYQIAFKNISETPFDSVKVKMVLTDKDNRPTIIPIPRRKPLTPSGTANDTLRFGGIIPTVTNPGLNTIFFEANNDNDQPEQTHFNNLAFKTLYVKPDSLSPLLDVTFDGVHILNRDIVASKPAILIKLKDEAKWMILNDTALLTVSLRYPDGRVKRFSFNNDTLVFTPAAQAPNTDNTAIVNFRPYLLEDGMYELIVTGKDKSNNTTGAIEYRIAFQVINKPMISNMLNYPNPFTTSTAFVFTVTGVQVPQQIKIEIMTITGKIVREITQDELGPIHVGRNITDFKWDGTDQYGQKLANGVYLYRVVTNLNGKQLDKYAADGDNTDQYFNKGYGKMYLMR